LKEKISKTLAKYTFPTLLIVLLLLSSSFISHKFYVSITEIRLNDENNTIEISMRIFPDDLDRAISQIQGVNPQIATELEHEDADKWIEDYVLQRFSLQLNGIKIKCSFLGKEQESDAVWCYFEGKFTGSPKELTVTQKILTDSFEDQVNIVQFYHNDFNKGIMLDKSKTTEKLQILSKKEKDEK